MASPGSAQFGGEGSISRGPLREGPRKLPHPPGPDGGLEGAHDGSAGPGTPDLGEDLWDPCNLCAQWGLWDLRGLWSLCNLWGLCDVWDP